LASVQASFCDHSEFLDSYVQDFPNLQSSVELEQLSICDLLVAEIGRGLVLVEQAVVTSRGAFAKVKQTLRAKNLAAAWSFPPTDTFIGDLLVETGDRIDIVSRRTTARRLCLYRLHSDDGSPSPDAIRTFVSGCESA
jgi:hypothetical protein